MASKPETTFRLSVERHLPPTLYRVKLNLPLVGGIPDSWYSGRLTDLWVEYKYIKCLPQRVPVKIDLSTLQVKWLRDRFHEGRNVAVIVGHPEGGIWLDDLDWERPIPLADVPVLTISRKQLSQKLLRFVNGD